MQSYANNIARHDCVFFEDFKSARKKQQFILCLCRETGQYFEESLRGCEVVTNLNERENY